MLGIKRLFTGLVLATLALSIGCKSNKDAFSGLSSSSSAEENKDGIDVITTVERSAPAADGKGNISMPDVFESISKEDFLTQVSDAEKSVYGLDKDNLYDYYRLILTLGDGGMRCTQYLAMGKRVWSKLRRKKVDVEKNRLGYGFKVFEINPRYPTSQTVNYAPVRIDFYCSADGNGTPKHHRVMIVYESSQGMNPHTSGSDIITDTKIPLVYPRFEALRGDSENGKLRLRDIALIDTNAYLQDLDNDVPALAITP